MKDFTFICNIKTRDEELKQRLYHFTNESRPFYKMLEKITQLKIPKCILNIETQEAKFIYEDLEIENDIKTHIEYLMKKWKLYDLLK